MLTSSNGKHFRVTGPMCGEFTGHQRMFSLIRGWTNGWTNYKDAGNLRCHYAHYDVTVMGWCIYASVNCLSISSGNGLSLIRHQAITWTNAGLLLIGLLGTNFSEIRIGIPSFSFKKMHLKLSSAKMAAIFSRGDELSMVARPLYQR